MKHSILSAFSAFSAFSALSIFSIQSIQSILSNQSIQSPQSPNSPLHVLVAMLLFTSCTIEPPLRLPREPVETVLPIVVNELEVVWNVDIEWDTQWYYGWDEEDERRWGKLEYPTPTYFEVRRFYQGEELSDVHHLEEEFTVYGNKFKRHYAFGYHDLLVWSNIDSPDGTQTVLIDESDPDNVLATTTAGSTSYDRPSSRQATLKKQPDIFYAGYERSFYISRNVEDYDRFDEEENAWVKEIRTTLDPVVYIYLIQVVVYNNDGLICGLADDATLTGLAQAVNLNTGHTSASDVDVVFGMRMKNGLKAVDGRDADILGSMFTTFGLCDMEPWRTSRGPQYMGSRTDLANCVLLDLLFSNSTDALFAYDVTQQMQRQTHGGVITIEIDADTITVPKPGSAAGSGFKPTVEEYGDSIINEFGV